MRVFVGASRVMIVALISVPGCHGQKEKVLPDPRIATEVVKAGVPLNRPAPEIVGEDTEGKVFRLSEHRGKVVLLSFWAHF